MSSSIKVKINIAGRQYPLTVHPDEEVVLRDAGREINRMIREFEERYAVTDKQDALSMVALQMASSLNLQKENAKSKQKSFDDKLKNLLSLFQENEKI